MEGVCKVDIPRRLHLTWPILVNLETQFTARATNTNPTYSVSQYLTEEYTLYRDPSSQAHSRQRKPWKACEMIQIR